MSFLSDLFEGKTGNLGNDLSPSNIFSDAGKDYASQPNWLKDVEIAAPLAIGAGLTLGGDLPLLGAAGGLGDIFGGAADTVGGSIAGVGGDIGADLSTTVGGGLSDLAGAALPAGATLDAGTGITGGVAGGLGDAFGGRAALPVRR